MVLEYLTLEVDGLGSVAVTTDEVEYEALLNYQAEREGLEDRLETIHNNIEAMLKYLKSGKTLPMEARNSDSDFTQWYALLEPDWTADEYRVAEEEILGFN